MPTFTGSKVKNTYKRLLQVSQAGNLGFDATLRFIEDGIGTASPLKLSTSQVEITGIFTISNKLTLNSLLNAATGDEAALTLNYTVNKLTSGAGTAIKIVETDTASPGERSYLECYTGANRFFRVTPESGGGANTAVVLGNVSSGVYGSWAVYASQDLIFNCNGTFGTEMLMRHGNATGSPLRVYSDSPWARIDGAAGAFTFNVTGSASSAVQDCFRIAPTWNQSGTAGSTDLLIKRTDTAVGSGEHRFIDAQIGTTRVFGVGTNGYVTIENVNYPYFHTKSNIVGNWQLMMGGPYAIVAAKYSNNNNIYYIGATENTNAIDGYATLYGAGSKSSGTDYGCSVNFTAAQSGTAASTALLIQRTDTSVGSGLQNLIDTKVGSTSYFSVNNAGKAIINAALSNATGDEVAVQVSPTVNKATSGTATAIRMDVTDSASPSDVYFIRGFRGVNEVFTLATDAGEYPGASVKWWTGAGGYAHFSVLTTADSGKWAAFFANGTATANALASGDVGIYYDGNSNKGFKFLSDQIGAYCYAPIVASAVRIGEAGGGSAVDVGIIRGASNVLQVFNGDVNSPVSAKLQCSAIVAPDGSPDAITIDNAGNLTLDAGCDLEWSTDVGLERVAASILKLTDGGSGYGAVQLDANVRNWADTVTLTNNSATDLFDITLADGDNVAGVMHYAVFVVDASAEQQVHAGQVTFVALNKGGTITTDINEITVGAGGEVDILTTGTLTDAFTAVDGTGKVTVKANFASSLTPTTMELVYDLSLMRPRTFTKKA